MGFIATNTKYFAIRALPLGDASAIFFSSPVFVMLIACMYLKEPCGFIQIVQILLTISGVIFVARPEFIFVGSEMIDIDGLIFAIASSLATGSSFVAMRKLQKTPTGINCFENWLITNN